MPIWTAPHCFPDVVPRRHTLPELPEPLEWVRLTNLAIGNASLDLMLTRHQYDVGITVLRRVGDVEIVSVK